MKKPDGYKNYGELTENDKINIINLYYQKNMTIDEMSLELKLTKRTIPQVLKDFHINSRIKNRYTLDESYFEVIDSERKAYWLGFIYADGFVGDERFNNFVLSQKETDGYLIDEFAKDINFTGEIRTTIPSSGFKNGMRQRVINFSSKIFVNSLYKLNVFTKKSMTMDLLPNIDDNLMRHFIRGYFDGDGCISRYLANDKRIRADGSIYITHRYRFNFSIIGTKPFLEKLLKYIPARMSFVDSCTDKMKYINTNAKCTALDIYNFLYDDATIYMVRKFNIWQQIIGDVNKKLLER